MQDWVWLISLIGSLGAFGAAVAAWKSAKATQRTASAQILMNIMDAYRSPEMLSGMIKLGKWAKENNFAKIFADKRDNNYDEIKELDEARRSFSHHFHKIWLLQNAGLINTAFVKKVVSPGQVVFLLKIIEPMEKAMNPDYDHSTFDFFRAIYPKES